VTFAAPSAVVVGTPYPQAAVAGDQLQRVVTAVARQGPTGAGALIAGLRLGLLGQHLAGDLVHHFPANPLCHLFDVVDVRLALGPLLLQPLGHSLRDALDPRLLLRLVHWGAPPGRHG
jgi:hypothetical protein